MERWLVAALAVHRGRSSARSPWWTRYGGEDPPRTAAKTLQNYVLRARRAMAGSSAEPS